MCRTETGDPGSAAEPAASRGPSPAPPSVAAAPLPLGTTERQSDRRVHPSSRRPRTLARVRRSAGSRTARPAAGSSLGLSLISCVLFAPTVQRRLSLAPEGGGSEIRRRGQICWEFVVSFSLEKNPPIHVPPLSHSQLPPSHRRLSPTIILRVRLREIKVCPFSHDISIYGQRYLDRGRAVAAWGCRRWLDGVRVRHGRLRRAATAYIAFYDYSVICSCRDRDGRTGGLTGAGGRARTVGRSGARPSP